MGSITRHANTGDHPHDYTGSCAPLSGPELVYELAPSVTGSLMISLSGEVGRGMGYYVRGGGCVDGTELICEATAATKTIHVTAGQAYYLFIDSAGLSGSFDLLLSLSTCGDGVRDEGEQCDDGNNTSGDGCSNECTMECTGPVGSVYVLSDTTYSCYRFITAKSNWADAESSCAAWKGHLASIVDATENTFVHDHIAENTRVWLGGKRSGSVFQWQDGTPWSYDAWATGEPNSSDGTEDRVEMRPDGLWNDAKRNNKNAAVCKRMPAGSLP